MVPFGSGGTLSFKTGGGVLGVGYKQNGSVTVSEGVTINSSKVYLGYGSGSIGTATVKGAGSTWANSGTLYIGNSGSGTLNVEAGGQVTSITGSIGESISSTGTVTVTAANWTNNGELYVGRVGTGALIINEGGQVSNTTGYLGDNPGSIGTAIVSGPGSTWINSRPLYIGDEGNGALTIEAGGQVRNTDAYLGYLSGSAGTAIVRGAGSQWINSGQLQIRAFGSGELTIEEGGQVSNSNGSVLGTAYVRGIGSEWNSSGTFSVSGNVTIEAGGGVNSALGRIGGGTVSVKGPGSKWTNIGNLDVGYGSSSGGYLVIETGGEVATASSCVGCYSELSGTAKITVMGSKLTNSGYLNIQRLGTLKVEAGGQVVSATSRMDGSASAIVSGEDSKWTNSGRLELSAGSASTLIVLDGAEVVTGELSASLSNLLGDGMITATQGAILDADLVFDAEHGNRATVPFGTGGTLTVVADGGVLGVNGSLIVSEGVSISSSSGIVGNSQSNLVGSASITGPGSKWTIGSSLSVPRGVLNIEAGAEVSSTYAFVGGNSGPSGVIKVAGTGSYWRNNGDIRVGTSPAGIGMLTIEAGGVVSGHAGIVGDWAGSTGIVTVSGPGSKWATDRELTVGVDGNGSIIVRDGGEVWHDGTGYLGRDAGSIGMAIVTGVGSRWIVDSSVFYVGKDGSGLLTITSGGLVKVGSALYQDTDWNRDSFINVASGGMLALLGDADDSLLQFLGLVRGHSAIRYWNATLADWSPLTAATFGTDYTLQYLTTGDLAGYTVLTVGRVGDVDFDGDGDVDGRDFLVWQRHPELGSLADWQNAYGAEAPPATESSLVGTSPVPEPSCLVLLLGTLLLRRRGGG